MTQKDLIFSFLLKNPNARPKEISKALKLKPESVRGRLFDLRKEKILSNPVRTGKKRGTVKIRKTKQAKLFQKLLKKIKPKAIPKPKLEPIIEEEEEEEFLIYKKTLGLTLYCSKQEQNFKAIMFEETEFPDREDFLRSALIDWTRNECGEIEKANLGYEVDEWYDFEDLGVVTFERD